MPPSTKIIVGVLNDLFFRVKIQDAANRAGAGSVFVTTAEDALASLQGPKALMVVDLNCSSIDPIDLVKRVKDGERDIPVIGFVSHVQVDLRKRAEEAGYDAVVARSAFSSNLVDILRHHIG
jgi:CheY-like chemotaxis protein